MTTSARDEFDLIVIGAGMAGMNAAGRAQEAGVRVAVIERDRVGGTCPVRGCIPTKALVRSAEIAHEIARADEFGISVGSVEVDFAKVMGRVRAIIDKGSNGARGWLESLAGVELIEGDAELLGPREVRVDGRVLHGASVIVATGAAPRGVPIPGLDATPHWTSDDLVLRVTELPSRLLVIGAGPIGLELGQALSRLGSRVSVIDVVDRLMPDAEPEISEEMAKLLGAEGVDFILGATIERVEAGPAGGPRLIVSQGGTARPLDGDALLVAVGRGPAVAGLGLDAAGVEHSPKGVPVDARLRTNRESVWAAGDVLGEPFGAFTHVARRLGREVVDNVLALDPHDVDRDVGPRAVFTDPEFASIGLTEARATEAGHQIRTAVSRFSGGKARAWGEERGLVKIVADADDGRLLGAHILGYHAADLLHPVVVAMQAPGGTGAPIVAARHIHPTLGEAVQGAVAQVSG